MDPSIKSAPFFQVPWRTNIENDRHITLVEQQGYEGLAEISRPSGQQHLHYLLPNLPAFRREIWRQAGAFVGIE